MAQPLATLRRALAAALLADLAEAGTIALRADEVVLLNTTPRGDPLLDEALGLLRATPPPRRPRDLVARWSGIPDLQQRVYGGLVDRGIVARRARRLLGVLHTERYPVLDQAARDAVRRQVHAALAGVHEPEPRLRSLIGLLFVCGLEAAILVPAEGKTRHARAQAITLRDPVSDAVHPYLPIGPPPNRLF